MMQISAQPFTSEAIYRQEAITRKARLGLSARATVAPKALPAPVVEKACQRPLWARESIQFDNHVAAWKRQIHRGGDPKYLAYIRRRCAEANISYEDIQSQKKNRRTTSVRQEIMLGLRTEFNPPPSYAQIGRLLGGRDHSSICHVAKAAASRAALPIPVFRTHIEALYGDKALAAAIRTDYLIGMTFDAMGGKYHLGYDTIRRFAKENGWTRDPRSEYVKAGETPKAIQNQIAELYQLGLPLRGIAAQCGVAVRTVGHIRRKLGIAVRPR